MPRGPVPSTDSVYSASGGVQQPSQRRGRGHPEWHKPYASGEIGTTRDAAFNAAEYRPPIAILERFQWDPEVRQRMASDDTVLIGLDEPVGTRVQSMPKHTGL